VRVIIAGSRTITDMSEVLIAIHDSGFAITEVVCGGATGVDNCGRFWAASHNIPVKMFPAQWDKHGPAAGPIRNRTMAENADALILVWDGRSRGSRNMLSYARSSGLKIHERVVPA
jgi:hypothetical protein